MNLYILWVLFRKKPYRIPFQIPVVTKKQLKTQEAATQLLDYLHTYNNASLRFHKSDMKLHIDSDAAYLVLLKARSRFARHFSMVNKNHHPQKFCQRCSIPWGTILTLHTLKL